MERPYRHPMFIKAGSGRLRITETSRVQRWRLRWRQGVHAKDIMWREGEEGDGTMACQKGWRAKRQWRWQLYFSTRTQLDYAAAPWHTCGMLIRALWAAVSVGQASDGRREFLSFRNFGTDDNACRLNNERCPAVVSKTECEKMFILQLRYA